MINYLRCIQLCGFVQKLQTNRNNQYWQSIQASSSRKRIRKNKIVIGKLWMQRGLVEEIQSRNQSYCGIQSRNTVWGCGCFVDVVLCRDLWVEYDEKDSSNLQLENVKFDIVKIKWYKIWSQNIRNLYLNIYSASTYMRNK